jgi:hypothetical protein
VTGAHGPGNLSGPSSDRPRRPSGETPLRSRGPAPYHQNSAHPRAGRPLGRNSASLEGWTPPRAKLRLARGLCAPSIESPPRSRLSQVLCSRTNSSGRSIKCSDTTWTPGSKANPHHAGPLTPPGNHISALFRQPSRWDHTYHYTVLCGKASISSVTLCCPLSYGLHTAPSKEDGRTLEKGTNACLAHTRGDAMMSDH